MCGAFEKLFPNAKKKVTGSEKYEIYRQNKENNLHLHCGCDGSAACNQRGLYVPRLKEFWPEGGGAVETFEEYRNIYSGACCCIAGSGAGERLSPILRCA